MQGDDPYRFHRKYLDQLVRIVRERSINPDEPRVVMLSGGVDSLMLLAIAARLFPGRVEALTIAGDANTSDVIRAANAAEDFAIPFFVVRVGIADILANLEIARGTEIRTLSRFLFYVTHRIAFEQFDIDGRDVLQGDGADALYGSSSARIYVRANDVARERGCSLDEARTFLKRQHFADSLRFGSGTGAAFASLAEEYGGNAVQPYLDERVRWINDLPYSLVQPNRKQFPRDALQEVWGIDATGARRISMQEGSGLYEQLKIILPLLVGADSPNVAVRKLTCE